MKSTRLLIGAVLLLTATNASLAMSQRPNMPAITDEEFAARVASEANVFRWLADNGYPADFYRMLGARFAHGHPQLRVDGRFSPALTQEFFETLATAPWLVDQISNIYLLNMPLHGGLPESFAMMTGARYFTILNSEANDDDLRVICTHAPQNIVGLSIQGTQATRLPISCGRLILDSLSTDIPQLVPAIAQFRSLRSLSWRVPNFAALQEVLHVIAPTTKELTLDSADPSLRHIPAEIARCTDLRSIHVTLPLDDAGFAELLTTLPVSVERIHLSRCGIRHVPAELARFVHLTGILLEDTAITDPHELDVFRGRPNLRVIVRGNDELYRLSNEISRDNMLLARQAH